jgi:capsular polysaccharide transport system ATP-binding protein
MITLDNVHKRYWTNRGEVVWALRDVTLSIPHGRHVALIGSNGAGKSTLLRLIAGIDEPTRGTVQRDRRVSWPLGIPTGLQGTLSGKQNARFISRLQGFTEEEIDQKIEFVRVFSELGDTFEKPIATYSKGMRGRLNFALSVAFEYDVYLIDERMGAGGGTSLFKQKTDNTMSFLRDNADLILASHSEKVVKSY